MSVQQNVAFGLNRLDRAERRVRVAEMLELVGLGGFESRRPHELSGGQRQRVALARALAPEPQLILLDEPFSALDARLRQDLREEVRALLNSVGSTVLLVTHDQAEAMAMADHLVVMRAGRAVAAGRPRDVYDEPVDLELAHFLGTASTLPGRLVTTGGSIEAVDCSLGRLVLKRASDFDGECTVLLRPEDVTLNQGAASAVGTCGVVIAASYFGGGGLLRVRLDAGGEVAVATHGYLDADLGDRVQVDVTRPVSVFEPSSRSADAPKK